MNDFVSVASMNQADMVVQILKTLEPTQRLIAASIAPIRNAANEATKILERSLGSQMQAILEIQSEQIAQISRSLPDISPLYLNGVHSDVENNELDDVLIADSISREETHNRFISRENFFIFVKYLLKKFVELIIIEPFIKSSFDEYLKPILQSFWNWWLIILSEWW